MNPLNTARLIGLRRHAILGRFVHRVLRVASGVEVPDSVHIGDDLVVHHHGFGLVIHSHTSIGHRVHLFQGVTIGRSDVWIPRSQSQFDGVVIEDDVWICAGAAVIGGPGRLVVGRGTIVGANAVLLESTGEWEIWAGAPARCVGRRTDAASLVTDGQGGHGCRRCR